MGVEVPGAGTLDPKCPGWVEEKFVEFSKLQAEVKSTENLPSCLGPAHLSTNCFSILQVTESGV